MSLKTFHIFFIAVSILLVFGFGAWLLVQAERSTWSILGAIASFVCGIALIVYGMRILKKFRQQDFK